MAHLTLAGLSGDGKRLLLVGDNGAEYTLDIDNALRAAIRGDHARIGQLEITMDSTLRPRDIQARIRAGESAEAVALAAQTTVERIMPFAAPVLAERAHVAQRAQSSSVRRRSGETGARTLGEAVAAQLRTLNVDPSVVEWDAWRREDGRWTLTGQFTAPKRTGTATFAFDLRGNFVTVEDDHARWLVGDQVAKPAAGAADPRSHDDLQQARQRRLSAVQADELPLGEDAIELVQDGDATGRHETGDAPDVETTMDLTEATDQSRRESSTPSSTEPGPTPGEHQGERASEEQDETSEQADEQADEQAEETTEPPAAEAPPRRPARKGRGRASVPSWDEIMFGGGKSE